MRGDGVGVVVVGVHEEAGTVGAEAGEGLVDGIGEAHVEPHPVLAQLGSWVMGAEARVGLVGLVGARHCAVLLR